jgi:hypothetical protein
MNRTRIPAILATTAAALALGAGPALAGSDDCAGASCAEENAPAQVVPGVPVPVSPAPLPTTQTRTGAAAPERESNRPKAERQRQGQRHSRVAHRRQVVFGQQRTVPRGAVAAGAGGTADDGSNGALLGLAGLITLGLTGGAAKLALGRRNS